MSKLTYITDEMMPVFDGVIPSVLASGSASGIPNVTYISQVYYVDRQHVALSRQFFNKTVQNVNENPVARVLVTSPVTYNAYKLSLQFVESQTEGDVFTNMRIQLEVIAGMQGKTDTFRLLAADIYKVTAIEMVYEIPA